MAERENAQTPPELKRFEPGVGMPKRRAESPVVPASSSSSYGSPVTSISTSAARQSKRRRVVDPQPAQQPPKKPKSAFKVLRSKNIKAKLAATMTTKVTPKQRKESVPPTPDSISEHVELPSKEEEELESLREQLKQKDEQIQVQKLALSAIHQQVQCQICLDTLIRPYSLVPCGHIACLGCLQQWFTAPGPGTDTHPSAPVVMRRKKTCPHCRALVVQRPVAAFLIKEIILQVESSLNPNAAPTLNSAEAAREEDPWHNIFPAQHNGANRNIGGAIIDHEDGGVRRCNTCLTEIFRGVCQGCGEIYDFYEESEESDLEIGLGAMPLLNYWAPFDDRVLDDYGDDEDVHDAYDSDFIVNDDIAELEDDEEPLEEHEEHPFFHPAPQETIEISESDEDVIVPPRRFNRRANANPITLSDDELSDNPSVHWAEPAAIMRREMDMMTDEDDEEEEEERDVNWELQHPPHDYRYNGDGLIYRPDMWVETGIIDSDSDEY